MSKTKLLSLIAVCLVFFTVAVTFGKSKGADVQYYRIREVTEQALLQEREYLYFSDKSRKEMKKVYTSEMISLYCDEETGSISVYDTASKKLWRSIPEAYAGVKTGSVLMDVVSDGAIFTLSSQGDSTFSYETKENCVKIVYNFDASLPDKEKVKITLPVTYTLRNGILTAELDCSEILNESRSIIRSISLLPFFGADREGEKGDYLLVPDGPGLTVDLSENPVSFESLLVPVYGEDPSTGKMEDKTALVGAFGMKKGNSAFAGIIEEGAAISVIKADKALSDRGLNSVSAYFEITPTSETENGKLAVSKKSYDGKLRVSYRFLSARNADYVGMASAVREVLIRNGNLPMSSKEPEGDYPFNLSVIGVGYDENMGQTRIFTSYSQTYDILSALTAKGVSGINLRYRGLFDGGVNQRSIEKAELALGNTDELRELISYTESQGIRVFADVKLNTASEKGSFSDKAISLLSENTVVSKGVFEAYESHFLDPKKAGTVNGKMLLKLRETDFDGLCLADAGRYLCSDFSRNGALRNKAEELLKKELGSASANKSVMVDTGNLYSVKSADSVVNLPSDAFYGKRELCTSVPFIQSLYHGFFDYSLSPVNTAKNSETMFLRYAEYGAVPYFEWYYTDNSTEEKKDGYNYNTTINEAQLYYQRMSSLLSDLRGARITAHEKVKKNVYMTEFEGSTRIYVNYNKTAVTVSGVTIEPRSFVRVN